MNFYNDKQEFARKFTVTDQQFTIDLDVMVGESSDLHRVMLRSLCGDQIGSVVVLYYYDLARLHDRMLAFRTDLFLNQSLRVSISPNLELTRTVRPGEDFITALVEVRPGMTCFLQTGCHRTPIPLSIAMFDQLLNILPAVIKAADDSQLVQDVDPVTLTIWKKASLLNPQQHEVYLSELEARRSATDSQRLCTFQELHYRTLAKDLVVVEQAQALVAARLLLVLGDSPDNPIDLDEPAFTYVPQAPLFPIAKPGPTHLLTDIQVAMPPKEVMINFFAMCSYRDHILAKAQFNRQIYYTPENSIQSYDFVRQQAAYFHHLCCQCFKHLNFAQSSPTLDYVVAVLNDWGSTSPFLRSISCLNTSLVETEDMTQRIQILDLLYKAYIYSLQCK